MAVFSSLKPYRAQAAKVSLVGSLLGVAGFTTAANLPSLPARWLRFTVAGIVWSTLATIGSAVWLAYELCDDFPPKSPPKKLSEMDKEKLHILRAFERARAQNAQRRLSQDAKEMKDFNLD